MSCGLSFKICDKMKHIGTKDGGTIPQMQRNQQSCPHCLWSQLQMVHLETLPDLKGQRL